MAESTGKGDTKFSVGSLHKMVLRKAPGAEMFTCWLAAWHQERLVQASAFGATGKEAYEAANAKLQEMI